MPSLKRISNENLLLTAREVMNSAEIQNKISLRSAQSYRFKLFRRVAKQINFQTKKSRKKLLDFCRLTKSWSIQSWKEVAFSDEVRFELVSRRFAYVRRPIGQRNRLKYSIKFIYNYRRYIMFWRCIAADGRRRLVSIDTSINSHIYCDIMQNHFIHDFSYMKLLQDNAKPHIGIY